MYSKGVLSIDGMRIKNCDEMFCFYLMHTQCYLLWPSWVALSQKGKVKQMCWGAFSEKANFGFFERVLWKGKFWPKFSQNLPLQPKFAFSQNHWNMPKNWNLCPFRHSINFLDESHCKGTEELIQKNNWSHKKFSYFITERVKDSSF